MIRTILSAKSVGSDACRADYVLAPDVGLVLVQDGTARLLDLGGTFFALSATAAAMLHEALRVDAETAVCRLAARYQVEEARLRGDLFRLLNSLEQKAIILRRGRVPAPGPGRRLPRSVLLEPALRFIHTWPLPVRWKAKALLGLAYLSLRLFGLPYTIAAWQQQHRRLRPPRNLADREKTVQEVDEAVRSAAALHFLNAECKERALCCWSLLRVRGLAARVVVAVDLYPFKGHCWCQLDGRVLTDYEDHCQRFTPVFTYE